MEVKWSFRTVEFKKPVDVGDPWDSRHIPAGVYWVVEMDERKVGLIKTGEQSYWIEATGEWLVEKWVEGECVVGRVLEPRYKI